MFKVSVSVQSSNQNTIYAVLKRKLGREPSGAELRTEVMRILGEARDK